MASIKYLSDDFPRIVTLCGSTRFSDAYIKANRDETLKGNIVISVGLFGHKECLDMDGEVKEMLDRLHLRKIEIADEILVIDPTGIICGRCGKPSRLFTESSGKTNCCLTKDFIFGPYIGSSTKNEIAYAEKHGKKVRYLSKEMACTQQPGSPETG